MGSWQNWVTQIPYAGTINIRNDGSSCSWSVVVSLAQPTVCGARRMMQVCFMLAVRAAGRVGRGRPAPGKRRRRRRRDSSILHTILFCAARIRNSFAFCFVRLL